MTTTKTRAEKIAELRAFDAKGRNKAVQNHIKKLEAMSDEDFPAHLAKLEDLGRRFRESGTADRLVRGIAGKLSN